MPETEFQGVLASICECAPQTDCICNSDADRWLNYVILGANIEIHIKIVYLYQTAVFKGIYFHPRKLVKIIMKF